MTGINNHETAIAAISTQVVVIMDKKTEVK